MKHFVITLDRNPYKCHVSVDGKQLENVTKINVKASVNNLPEVTLTFIPEKATIIGKEGIEIKKIMPTPKKKRILEKAEEIDIDAELEDPYDYEDLDEGYRGSLEEEVDDLANREYLEDFYFNPSLTDPLFSK